MVVETGTQAEVTLFNLTNPEKVMRGGQGGMKAVPPLFLSLEYHRVLEEAHHSIKYTETERVTATNQSGLRRVFHLPNFPVKADLIGAHLAQEETMKLISEIIMVITLLL